MISFIFFVVIIAAGCALFIGTMDEEIRTVFRKLVDRCHGHSDPAKDMRAYRDTITQSRRI